jgi:hypothetical protein
MNNLYVQPLLIPLKKQRSRSFSSIFIFLIAIMFYQCGDPTAFTSHQNTENNMKNPASHLISSELPQVTIRSLGGLRASKGFAPIQLISETDHMLTLTNYREGTRDFVNKENGTHWSADSSLLAHLRDCSHEDVHASLDIQSSSSVTPLENHNQTDKKQTKNMNGMCIDTIDILIAYTEGAVADVGSEATLFQRINRDLALGNLAIGNQLEAGLVTPTVQYRVVDFVPVTYADLNSPSDTIITQLAQQNNGNDGLDILHDMRETLGADWVVLYAAPGWNQVGGATCGQVRRLLTDLNTAPLPYQDGFAWVNTLWVCEDRMASAHELGHLLGCTHNTSPNAGLLPSSQGFYMNGSQDIRSSLVGRPPLTNASLNRLPVYSNPLALWEGLPFGSTNAANCTGTIGVSHSTVSAYRDAQVLGGTGLRLSTLTSDLAPTNIGQYYDHELLYENIGCTTVTVSDVSLTNHDPVRFEIVQDECTGQEVMAGESCVVYVRFTPIDLDTEEATVILNMVESTAPWFSHQITAQGGWIRGDTNSDGSVNIADSIKLLDYLFGGETLVWLDTGDTNNDGIINIADSIYLLMYLFQGGEAPAQPFPEPGVP